MVAVRAAQPSAGPAEAAEAPPREVETIRRYARPLTPEEFWALPLVHEAPGKVELVDGEVHEMAPVGGQHGEVAGPAWRALDRYVQARGGRAFGRVLPDTAYRLTFPTGRPAAVRGPDVSFISADRLRGIGIAPADALPKQFVPAPPELAVEILSDSERGHPKAVADKLRDYREGGVLVAWYVDADLRVVRVYDFRGPRRRVRVLRGAVALTAPGVLPGFRLPLPALWAG
jgi:Uma2 family endonuclease